MALFFSLNPLRDSPHSGGGLEISIHITSHRGPAKDISLTQLTHSLQRLIDDGLQGIDPGILNDFQGVNLAQFEHSSRIQSPRQARVDLDALSLCFPELAKRNWLPEHFRPQSNSQGVETPIRMGDLYLKGSHFYSDPDDWGYHIDLRIWFPDRLAGTINTPTRLLFITPYQDSVHDFGDFLKSYWLEQIENFPHPVEVDVDGKLTKNKEALRQESAGQNPDLAAHYQHQLELRQTQIDLLTEKLNELRREVPPPSRDEDAQETSLTLALWKATSLKPGIFGFSIDLKALVRDTARILTERSSIIELGLLKPPKQD